MKLYFKGMAFSYYTKTLCSDVKPGPSAKNVAPEQNIFLPQFWSIYNIDTIALTSVNSR